MLPIDRVNQRAKLRRLRLNILGISDRMSQGQLIYIPYRKQSAANLLLLPSASVAAVDALTSLLLYYLVVYSTPKVLVPILLVRQYLSGMSQKIFQQLKLST